MPSFLAATAIDWRDLFLPACIPIFALALFVEWRWLRKRGQPFDGRGVFVNIGLGLCYLLFELVAKPLVVLPIAWWVYQHRVFEIQINAWTVLPAFFAMEFFYYWFHRTSHRTRWFWSAHVVHHSGEEMNLSTALRQGWLYSVTGWWIFFLPLAWLGVDPRWVFFFYAVDLAYQYFVHTEVLQKMPRWFEYVFNTPSHHRVHHGRNAAYIDCNYGGVFIVFDRWFGSFVPETEAVDYGLPHPPTKPRSLWHLNVDEFANMFRDAKRPGAWQERLKHFYMPPDYRRPSKD